MKTSVVNLNKELYDVYIGRGSKWGNPFRIGIHGNRDEVIYKYEMWLHEPEQENLLHSLGELRGKCLGCFCKPKRCHGDILAIMADNYVDWK